MYSRGKDEQSGMPMMGNSRGFVSFFSCVLARGGLGVMSRDSPDVLSELMRRESQLRSRAPSSV